jgi:hypothetical protein
MELSSEILKEPLSVLLVEGGTDKLFYGHIAENHFQKLPYKLIDIHGGGNMLKRALASAFPPTVPDSNFKIRIYCCQDNESEYKEAPDFDLESIRQACVQENLRNILSVDAIVANQMIESWFFYDLEGLYNHLKVPEDKRNPIEKYLTPTKCRKRDLIGLFQQYEKTYREGERKAPKFIYSLDIHKIVNNCPELKAGIELIKTQSANLRNHLFD